MQKQCCLIRKLYLLKSSQVHLLGVLPLSQPRRKPIHPLSTHYQRKSRPRNENDPESHR